LSRRKELSSVAPTKYSTLLQVTTSKSVGVAVAAKKYAGAAQVESMCNAESHAHMNTIVGKNLYNTPNHALISVGGDCIHTSMAKKK
jgi:hypothetical protein